MTAVHDNFVELRISPLKGDAASAQLEEDFLPQLHRLLGECAP